MKTDRPMNALSDKSTLAFFASSGFENSTILTSGVVGARKLQTHPHPFDWPAGVIKTSEKMTSPPAFSVNSYSFPDPHPREKDIPPTASDCPASGRSEDVSTGLTR